MTVLGCILAGAAGWYAWQGRAQTEQQTAGRPGAAGSSGGSAPAGRQAGEGERVPVEITAAAIRDVPIFLQGLGAAQAFNSVLVRSRVDGEIVKIAFEEGQMVKEGDLLAQIDPRPYQAALDGALARKAQNEATLTSNQADLSRTQQLAQREFATRQQLDQQTSGVRSQQAIITGDQASIDSARTQLDYTTIRSPLTGRTGLRLVDQGNIVRAGDSTGIVEVAQLQPISVLFTAPEAQLPAIAAALREGEVRVTASSSDGGTVLGEGKLALLNNEVDVASGTVRLKATFPNADDRLWPGLSVTTRLLVRTLRGVVTIPEEALQRGQDELFVYVVGAADKAEKRVVGAGAFAGGQVVITQGLAAGERVVTAGQSRLRPGSALDLARREPPGSGREANRAAESTGAVGAPPAQAAR